MWPRPSFPHCGDAPVKEAVLGRESSRCRALRQEGGMCSGEMGVSHVPTLMTKQYKIIPKKRLQEGA